MRKLVPIFAVLFCAAAWLFLSAPRQVPPPASALAAGVGPLPTEALAAVVVPSPVIAAAIPLAMAEPTGVQHVFRLLLDRGSCTLEKVEEVRGAFGRERAQRWQEGMLCCRLIAEDGRIIGERTLTAPDFVCVVLDPNDTADVPAAARLTADGPALFQVRFPEVAKAVKLEIHRISAPSRPADASTPVGRLLASIDLPVR